MHVGVGGGKEGDMVVMKIVHLWQIVGLWLLECIHRQRS
jgi:hypothetical protein